MMEENKRQGGVSYLEEGECGLVCWESCPAPPDHDGGHPARTRYLEEGVEETKNMGPHGLMSWMRVIILMVSMVVSIVTTM